MAKQKPKRKLPMPIYQVNRAIRNHGLSPEQIAWDDYLIPGTETLRNNFTTKGSRGTPDPDELTYLEEEYAGLRILELGDRPIPGSFDYDHMQQIHKHLFQDVYPWAGEQRTVGMSKRGRSYADVSDIPGIWHSNTKKLSRHNHFKGISDQIISTTKKFALNTEHPSFFRKA